MHSTWRCNNTGGYLLQQRLSQLLQDGFRAAAKAQIQRGHVGGATRHDGQHRPLVEWMRCEQMTQYALNRTVTANDDQQINISTDEGIDRSVNLKRVRYFPASRTGYPGNHSSYCILAFANTSAERIEKQARSWLLQNPIYPFVTFLSFTLTIKGAKIRTASFPSSRPGNDLLKP